MALSCPTYRECAEVGDISCGDHDVTHVVVDEDLQLLH